MNPLRILFAALFVYLMCRAAGCLLLRAVALRLRRGERVFCEFVTGAAVVSSLVFLLAALHLVYTSVLVALGLLLFLAAGLVRYQAPPDEPDQTTPLPLAWRLLFFVPYAIFGALYVIAAMSPEISPDGTGYHVGLVSRYYEHRGFFMIPNNMFAGLAGGVEMLFLAGFALGRHSAAAMVHLLFLLTLPFGMMAWARRAGLPKAGVIAALLFYMAPLAGKDGTIAYIDVATAAVAFGAFFFLEVWRQEGPENALVPAGVLAGFAFACKITAATTVVCALLYVLVTGVVHHASRRLSARRLGVVAFFATLFAAPWMLKDAIQFGNPFFPLFNHWFPNPFQYPMVEAEMRELMTTVNGVPFSRIPWEATVGGKLFGVLGPVFLLSPLALLSLRTKAGRRVLLVFIPLFLPFFTNINARFLVPSLPFLALGLALGICSIPRVGTALAVAAVLLHAGLSWPDFMNRWSPGFQWRIDQTDWRVALRVIPEKKYLEDSWRDYKPGLLLDRFVPPGELVFSPGMGQMAYQHRDVLGTADSALGRRAFLTFLMPVVVELGSTWNREIHFPAVTTSRVRMVADTKMDTDLRISELRFALGATEITRNADWRVTASVNPWEVQLAFDNSLVSWWTAGQHVEKGLWVQADFAKPVTLDRVLLAQSEDQRWIALQPQALVDGQWKRLHARESDLRHPPRPTLRMEVRDELKRLNIHWILMPEGGYGADDLREKAAYWGITQVAEANGFRLWKLD